MIKQKNGWYVGQNKNKNHFRLEMLSLLLMILNIKLIKCNHELKERHDTNLFLSCFIVNHLSIVLSLW